MNTSYMLQGFKATRKTYAKKKSNMLLFIFYTLTSFFGKLFILPYHLFKMFDINLAKNAALHNEVNLQEGFRDTDDLNGNVKLWVISLLKFILLLSIIVIMGGVCAIAVFFGSIIAESTEFAMITYLLAVPFVILAVAIAIVMMSLFTPATYVTLNIKDKTLYNILYCSKASLKPSMVLKMILYNFIYILGLLVVPAIIVTLLSMFELNVLILVAVLILLIAQVFVFGYFKLAKDIAIYLLFRNNVKLDPKKEKRDTLDLSEEEKLTEIFTQE